MLRKGAIAGGRGDGAERRWHANSQRDWNRFPNTGKGREWGRDTTPRTRTQRTYFSADGDGKGRLRQQPVEPLTETARGSKVPHCTYRHGPGKDARAQATQDATRERKGEITGKPAASSQEMIRRLADEQQ